MKRVLLADPVCAQLLGHNLSLLINFRKYILSLNLYDKVELVSSTELPENLSTEFDVERLFHFYYHNRMNISGSRKFNSFKKDADHRNYEEECIDFAIEDFRNLISRLDVKNDDSIFYPGVDFYGAFGALQELQRHTVELAPSLYLRFMGVMEYSSRLFPDPRRELLRQIRACISKGYRIRLSAESSLYADHLATALEEPVAATPVPPFQSCHDLDGGDEFVVICPGSGRIDKGFNILPEIVKMFRINHEDKNVRFVIQNLPPWELENNIKYVTQLYATPGVEVLPASINFHEMSQLYKRSHIVLMPYDPNTYAMRSSAILTESVAYGRQVVTSRGTGFEGEVAYFNLGKLCSSVVEYADAIAQYSSMARSHLTSTSNQVRQRYVKYCSSQYREFLQ